MLTECVTKPVTAKLSAEMLKVLHVPDVKDRFFQLVAESAGNMPEQFDALIKSESAKRA